jgi:cell division protein FtsW
MAKRVSVDRWLFTVTMLLVFVGLVMVFSASAVMARERFGSEYAFLSKQLIWAVAGLAAMVVTMRVDYRRYKHPAIVFSLMGVTTLLLISVFFLDRSHNTHRWIHAGGFSFQPSELAKPVLILFLAYFLESPISARPSRALESRPAFFMSQECGCVTSAMRLVRHCPYFTCSSFMLPGGAIAFWHS